MLWYGEKILVLDALCDAGIGVDTLQDLEKVRQLKVWQLQLIGGNKVE